MDGEEFEFLKYHTQGRQQVSWSLPQPSNFSIYLLRQFFYTLLPQCPISCGSLTVHKHSLQTRQSGRADEVNLDRELNTEAKCLLF